MTMSIEDYAINLVVKGAESVAEDDLNEDGKIEESDHQAACDLAIRIAHAISADPDAVLTLVPGARPTMPMETPDELGRAAVSNMLRELLEEAEKNGGTEPAQLAFDRLVRLAAQQWEAGEVSPLLTAAVRLFVLVAQEADL